MLISIQDLHSTQLQLILAGLDGWQWLRPTLNGIPRDPCWWPTYFGNPADPGPDATLSARPLHCHPQSTLSLMQDHLIALEPAGALWRASTGSKHPKFTDVLPSVAVARALLCKRLRSTTVNPTHITPGQWRALIAGPLPTTLSPDPSTGYPCYALI